jgi:short-subunit dehydrogenase
LAKRGYDLILVARNEARLKALCVRLTSKTGRYVTPLRADLNDKVDLAKVETTLRDHPTTAMTRNHYACKESGENSAVMKGSSW